MDTLNLYCFLHWSEECRFNLSQSTAFPTLSYKQKLALLDICQICPPKGFHAFRSLLCLRALSNPQRSFITQLMLCSGKNTWQMGRRLWHNSIAPHICKAAHLLIAQTHGFLPPSRILVSQLPSLYVASSNLFDTTLSASILCSRC